jgi:hypothetical protein
MNTHSTEHHFLEHDRFFFLSGEGDKTQGWYTETREGVLGPYKSHYHAEKCLDLWVISHPSKR